MEIRLEAVPGAVTLDTQKTAVIVVDMQNAFCSKGGMLDVLGMLDEAKVGRVIETDKKVIEATRRAGIRIIYLRMGYRPDLSDFGREDSPNYWKQKGIFNAFAHPESGREFLIIGGWDHEIIDELKPEPEDIVVDKNRYSGFSNTELDVILKTLGARHLLFLGIATNICVESTLREAFFREYFPVLVKDGCGNLGPDFTQEATAWNVATSFGWVTTSEDVVKGVRTS